MGIAPVNITAAALIAQFLLIIIMFGGAMILKKGEAGTGPDETSRLVWVILFVFIVTVGVLLFAEEFIPTWQPLFGETIFPSVRSWLALHLVFILNIACVSIMVFFTGGSRRSAFGSIFFILPALAIFLREPLSWLVVHLVLVGLGFSLCLLTPEGVFRENKRMNTVAYWFVAIACLALTTFVGYVTRPR